MSSNGSGPPAPQPAESGHLPPEEFDRWYGGWGPLTPSTIGAFMTGFDRPWWIIGGWSIEALTGVPRAHEDMDISILSSDADAFRLFLGDRWTPWNVDDVTRVGPDQLLYARPEVTLMFKAALAREKDRRDADVALPMLDDTARRWLHDAVERIHPGHAWLGTR